MTAGGNLMEVLSDPFGNTWTIITTDHHGVSCISAAGEGLRLSKVLDPET